MIKTTDYTRTSSVPHFPAKTLDSKRQLKSCYKNPIQNYKQTMELIIQPKQIAFYL